MKRTALFFIAVALLLPVQGGSASTSDDATTTLTGEYVWTNRDVSDALEAKFTATGDGTWDVDFHFNFRDEPHIYSGTAAGSLSDGHLEGTVKNESKKRTFVFAGEVEDGTFQGTHGEMRDGGKRETGTLTLE